MKYVYVNEIWFEADPCDSKKICEAIWRGQRFKIHRTVEDWMDANAKIATDYTGKPCSSANFGEHVRDLLKLGLLRPAGDLEWLIKTN